MKRAAVCFLALVCAAMLPIGVSIAETALPERWETEAFDMAYSFADGMAIVARDGKYGFVDTSGRIAIPLVYEDARSFGNGYAGVMIEGKFGFIDKAGNLVIEPRFDDVRSFKDGACAVRIGEKWGVIDTSGSMILPQE